MAKRHGFGGLAFGWTGKALSSSLTLSSKLRRHSWRLVLWAALLLLLVPPHEPRGACHRVEETPLVKGEQGLQMNPASFTLLTSTSRPLNNMRSTPTSIRMATTANSKRQTTHNDSSTTTESGWKYRGAPGAYFPPDYAPVPPANLTVPDSAEDLDIVIFYFEFTMEDARHAPFALTFVLETFGDLKPSAYAPSGMYISPEEREALRLYRLQKEQLPSSFSWNHPNSPSSALLSDVAVSRDNEPEPVRETLVHMIQGNYVGANEPPPVGDVMDRYFVHQQELSLVKNSLCEHFVELLHIPDRPPLIVTMHSWMVSRFGLRCLFLRTPQLRTARRKFVLVSPEGDNASGNSFESDSLQGEIGMDPNYNVSYLLNHPLLLHWYGLNGDIEHPKFTATPIGSRPFHRSGTSLTQNSFEEHNDNVRQNAFTQLYLMGLDLNQLFPHIPHELHYGRVGCVWLEKALELFAGRTIDPPVEWIPFDQLPERVTTIYIVEMPAQKRSVLGRHSYLEEVLLIHEEPGNRASAAAQHIALLPFTAALYQKLQQHPFGSPERQNKIISAFNVWDFRRDIFTYLHTPEMEPHVYTVKTWFHDEFAHILNNYTFVMSPVGYGYDCYRTWEALSYGAIPIVQDPGYLWKAPHKYEELQASALTKIFQDLPVVVVGNFSEINPDNLTKWQTEIHDKFVRGEYKIEKIFAQYWFDRFSSHTNDE